MRPWSQSMVRPMRATVASMDFERQSPGVAALSLAGLVLAWQAASTLTADPSVLPSPAAVARIVVHLAETGELAHHISATLFRVAGAFGLAFALGALLGGVMGRSQRLDRWLDPWLVVFLNVPALVVIVLCYLWIGLNETAAIVAVAVNKTAMVAVTIREGVRALEPRVVEMARLYGMSAAERLWHVTLPQLMPYILASIRNGLAIIWKIVLVVEFLGRSNGVGFQIHLHFQLFDVGTVLAWSFSFVGLMLLIEMALVKPLELRTTAWRRAVS